MSAWLIGTSRGMAILGTLQTWGDKTGVGTMLVAIYAVLLARELRR